MTYTESTKAIENSRRSACLSVDTFEVVAMGKRYRARIMRQANRDYRYVYAGCPSISIEGVSPASRDIDSVRRWEAFVRKALEESRKGKVCVLLLPVSTSTALFHDVIMPNAAKIEFIRGRLKFEQRDETGEFRSKGCGQHDSMVVVFGEQKNDYLYKRP